MIKSKVLSYNSHISLDIYIKVIEWIIDLSNTLQYKSDVAFLNVNYLSRAILRAKVNKPAYLEAMGLVCFAVAAKFDDADCLTLEDVAKYAGNKTDNGIDYSELEAKILESLQYRLVYNSALRIFNEIIHLFCISKDNCNLG